MAAAGTDRHRRVGRRRLRGLLRPTNRLDRSSPSTTPDRSPTWSAPVARPCPARRPRRSRSGTTARTRLPSARATPASGRPAGGTPSSGPPTRATRRHRTRHHSVRAQHLPGRPRPLLSRRIPRPAGWPPTGAAAGRPSAAPASLRPPTPGSSPTPTRAASAGSVASVPPSTRRSRPTATRSPTSRRATTTSPTRNLGQFAAAAGFDAASGLGTPVDQNLAPALQGADGCPSVAAVSPNTGPVSGGGRHHHLGGGFANATSVTFGSVGAGRIVAQSATSITVVPPKRRAPHALTSP